MIVVDVFPSSKARNYAGERYNSKTVSSIRYSDSFTLRSPNFERIENL